MSCTVIYHISSPCPSHSLSLSSSPNKNTVQRRGEWQGTRQEVNAIINVMLTYSCVSLIEMKTFVVPSLLHLLLCLHLGTGKGIRGFCRLPFIRHSTIRLPCQTAVGVAVSAVPVLLLLLPWVCLYCTNAEGGDMSLHRIHIIWWLSVGLCRIDQCLCITSRTSLLLLAMRHWTASASSVSISSCASWSIEYLTNCPQIELSLAHSSTVLSARRSRRSEWIDQECSHNRSLMVDEEDVWNVVPLIRLICYRLMSIPRDRDREWDISCSLSLVLVTWVGDLRVQEHVNYIINSMFVRPQTQTRTWPMNYVACKKCWRWGRECPLNAN